MSESVRKGLILEAIDHLRYRKARPDITRISTYLLKRHGIPYEVTKQNLIKCVEDASVFRVEYKGFISYRNAAKLLRSKNTKRGPPGGNNVLMKVFAELHSESPDIAAKGISRFHLLTTLVQKYPRRSHAYFNHFVDRAISRGLFFKLKSGNLIPKKFINATEEKHDQISTPKSKQKPKTKKKPKMMSPMQRRHWMLKPRTPNDKFRSPSPRKRIVKKIFDPSEDTELIESEQEEDEKNESIKSESEDAAYLSEDATELPEDKPQRPEYRICTVCYTLITTNGRDSKVATCIKCSSVSHFKCAYVNPAMKATAAYPWKCPQCICCKACKRSSITSSLISCANCALAYHRNCHIPNIKEDIQEQSCWLCTTCINKEGGDSMAIKSKFFCTPGFISKLKYEPSEHKQIWGYFKERKFGPEEDEIQDPSIPDVKDWTTDQVYKHMQNICLGAALSFKERNIDGAYLLRMSRVEVIQGLGLKMGSALKIFKEVVLLQKRRDDPKFYYL